MAIQVQWRGPRAKALARRGDLEAAEPLACDAVALAERSDFSDLHGNALMDLSEVLWIRGRFPRPAPGPGRPVPLTAIAPLIETFFDVRSAGPREGS